MSTYGNDIPSSDIYYNKNLVVTPNLHGTLKQADFIDNAVLQTTKTLYIIMAIGKKLEQCISMTACMRTSVTSLILEVINNYISSDISFVQLPRSFHVT